MEKILEREGMDVLEALDQARIPYQFAAVCPREATVTIRREIPRGPRGKVETQGWLKGIQQVLAARRVAISLLQDDRPCYMRRIGEPQAKVVITLCPTPQSEEAV